MKTNHVKIGTQFRSIIADSNALWEVTRKVGDDVYEAVVVNEPIEIDGKTYDGDFAGTVDVFQGERIRAIDSFDAMWRDLARKGEEFYEELKVGQIVHYHNSFGQYVRCEVVSTTEGPQLKPIALVGAWREHDLVRRFPDGNISEGYHAKKVKSGEPFKPNASNIYENPSFTPNKKFEHIDPTALDPLPLELPEPTVEEATYHAKIRFLNAISETASDHDRLDDPDEVIDHIRTMLDDGVSPWNGY